MSKSTLLLATLSGASVAALVLIASFGFSDSEAPIVAPQQISSPAESVATQPVVVRRAHKHTDAPVELAQAEVQMDEEPALTSEEKGEELVEDEQIRIANISASLRDFAEAEGEDKDWAEETTAAIANSLQAEKFTHFAIEEIVCGRTMCAIDLRIAEEEEDPDDRLAQLTGVGPFRNGGFADTSQENSVALFIAREGHELPQYDGT